MHTHKLARTRTQTRTRTHTHTHPHPHPHPHTQVEFADVILLNKSELLLPLELQRVRAAIVALNPSAKLHVTSYSKIDLSHVINTGLFSMEKAGQHAGWLKELRGEHVPETLEYAELFAHCNFVTV